MGGPCGRPADGECAYTLNLTDIHTTWVEQGALLGKSEVRVQETLERLRANLPFPLRGLEFDHGSEVLNAPLVRYCRQHETQFTRGRPSKKHEQASAPQGVATGADGPRARSAPHAPPECVR